MTTIFGEARGPARRAHKRPCDLCGEPIVAGDVERRYCVRDAGDFCSFREHATCSKLGIELWGHDDWPCTRWPLRESDEVLADARARVQAAREARP